MVIMKKLVTYFVLSSFLILCFPTKNAFAANIAKLPLNYCIDFVKYNKNTKSIDIQGWVLSGYGIKNVLAVVNGKTYNTNSIYRPDVYNVYKQYNNKNAGFSKSIHVSNGVNAKVQVILTEKNGKITLLNLKLVEQINFENSIRSLIKNNFNNISGNYSFAFLDLDNSNVISINNKKSKSASVIKIYIMINAFQQIKKGNIKLSDKYSLSQSDKVGGSGILINEPQGKVLTIEKLIELMITKSDNTATNILIKKLGMNSINNTIKSLGCTDTNLNRLMMDTNAIAKGIENYTSVNDLCRTLKKIHNNECVNKKYDSLMLKILKNNTNDKKIPALLPSNIEVANKTGENIGVENDAGIVFTPKGSYIVCFLTSNGSSNSQVSAISQSSKKIFDIYMKYKD